MSRWFTFFVRTRKILGFEIVSSPASFLLECFSVSLTITRYTITFFYSVDESNPALKNLQQDLLKKRLLVRKTVKLKDAEGKILAVKKMLSIVNGRKPRKLVCPPTETGKPCPLCFSNGKNHHEKFLPFRYYKPSTPTQSNDFDCGTYTLYAIRMWMQQETLVTSSLHQDSTRLWTPVDI